MSETAEQIQNSVLPEPPVAELPPLSSEPQTPEPEAPAQDETALTAEITELWQIHNDFKTSLRQQSQSLHSLRAELGKKLAEMKQILARPGCSGKWSSWLKDHKIARSTADRLVAKHERSLNPDPNCLTGSISEPTEAEIKCLLDKVAPKLRRVLRTPQSVYRFVGLLTSSLALDHKESEQGFIVLKPPSTAAVEQSVPQDAQAEPVPVITLDGLTGGDVQSAGASVAL